MKVLAWIALNCIAVIVVGFLIGIPLLLAWNYAAVPMTGLPEATWLQASLVSVAVRFLMTPSVRLSK